MFFLYHCGKLQAQQLILPRESNLYPDSIAIYLKGFIDRSNRDGKLLIESAYGDNYLTVDANDSVLIAPYYLAYDDEPVLYLFFNPSGKKRQKYIEQYAKLVPVKKNDAVESLIHAALKTQNHDNLNALAKRLEQDRCFLNAMFVYYKLYRLGFPKYWDDYIKKVHPPAPSGGNIIR